MSEIEVCPTCGVGLEKGNGLAGIVLVCPECKKEWVKCYDKFIPREEFNKKKREEA
jgi:predicted RNA-binding Zn-ribbon protein involved in translation (DUF1610 family)